MARQPPLGQHFPGVMPRLTSGQAYRCVSKDSKGGSGLLGCPKCRPVAGASVAVCARDIPGFRASHLTPRESFQHCLDFNNTEALRV